jgi:hypothetical protein
MSIFGTQAPMFVYNHGSSGEEAVLLDNAVIVRNEPAYDYVEHKSQIDGSKILFKRAKHYEVEIRLNLFKYSNPTGKFNTIANYEGKPVTLWLHRDGAQYKQTDDETDALFVLREVNPFYLNNTDYKDGLVLIFQSIDPIGDMARSSLYTPTTDTNIMYTQLKVEVTGTQSSPETFTTNSGKLATQENGSAYPVISLSTYVVSVVSNGSPYQDAKINQVGSLTQVGSNISFQLAISDTGNPSSDGKFYTDILIFLQAR